MLTKKQREALEFYADPVTWRKTSGIGQWRGEAPADRDLGRMAREALEAEKKPDAA